MKKYLERFHENSVSSEYLFFVNHKDFTKGQMSGASIQKIIREATRVAKQKDKNVPNVITPHMFRHSRAMNLYRKGMSLAMIAQLLGHSQLETTQIYAYADTEMKRKAIEKATESLKSTLVIPKEITDFDFKRKFGLA